MIISALNLRGFAVGILKLFVSVQVDSLDPKVIDYS